MTLLRKGFVAAFLLAASAGYAGKTAFWYEDNNVRKAGGYPADFKEMFENPDSWSEMRSHLSVYFIRGNTLKNLVNDLGAMGSEAFLWASGEKIPVAIDNLLFDSLRSSCCKKRHRNQSPCLAKRAVQIQGKTHDSR